jgi:hypothetical protein
MTVVSAVTYFGLKKMKFPEMKIAATRYPGCLVVSAKKGIV